MTWCSAIAAAAYCYWVRYNGEYWVVPTVTWERCGAGRIISRAKGSTPHDDCCTEQLRHVVDLGFSFVRMSLSFHGHEEVVAKSSVRYRSREQGTFTDSSSPYYFGWGEPSPRLLSCNYGEHRSDADWGEKQVPVR